jgi:5'-deoxynucleotidase YfbR-like HD superfamily hydrolase
MSHAAAVLADLSRETQGKVVAVALLALFHDPIATTINHGYTAAVITNLPRQAHGEIVAVALLALVHDPVAAEPDHSYTILTNLSGEAHT